MVIVVAPTPGIYNAGFIASTVGVLYVLVPVNAKAASTNPVRNAGNNVASESNLNLGCLLGSINLWSALPLK